MPVIDLLHNTMSLLAHDSTSTLSPRASYRKNRNDRVKFGKGYILRWQFALIIVAVVLAAVFVAWASYQLWKRRQVTKDSPERREFGEYVEGLRESRVSGAGENRNVHERDGRKFG